MPDLSGIERPWAGRVRDRLPCGGLSTEPEFVLLEDFGRFHDAETELVEERQTLVVRGPDLGDKGGRGGLQVCLGVTQAAD